MIKKIIGWSVFVLFSGLLIFGAIYRTLLKAEPAAPLAPGQSRQENDYGSGSSFQKEGNDNNGTNSLTEDLAEEDHALPGDRLLVAGEATQVDSERLSITTTDGGILQIERGAWRFALDQGFEIKIGDTVQMVGFYEEDEFEVVEIRNDRNQSVVLLRDEDGRPLWSGGRGN